MDETIRTYQAAFAVANGKPAPKIERVGGWYYLYSGDSGALKTAYRRSSLNAMAATLRGRVPAPLPTHQETRNG